MKRFFLPPVHLLVIFAHLMLAWAVVSCARGLQYPDLGSSPMPVTSGPTLTTPVTPSSSVFTSPTQVMDETTIPFQTLTQGFRLNSLQSKPALLIAADPTDRDVLVPLLDTEHQSLLTSVDLDKQVVLAAFWGAKPSGGFSITISNISITGSNLTVNVILNDNDPTVPRIDASTFPYHVVTIDRLALPKEASLSYRLVSDDTLLGEGELP